MKSQINKGSHLGYRKLSVIKDIYIKNIKKDYYVKFNYINGKEVAVVLVELPIIKESGRNDLFICIYYCNFNYQSYYGLCIGKILTEYRCYYFKLKKNNN